MLEGNRVSRISVRGFAVASASAVTAVGCVTGVATGNTVQEADADVEATASDATLLSDIPTGQHAQVHTASLTQQADSQAIAADNSARKDAEETARKKAAADAVAKQEAAKKAEAERRAKKEAASRSAVRDPVSFPVQASYTVGEVQAMARQIVPAGQFSCFSEIVERESSWNYQADNPTSDAYGLVQALPGSKMSSVSADWMTNPATQIKWGLSYMNERYDSPCGAWEFWQSNHWY